MVTLTISDLTTEQVGKILGVIDNPIIYRKYPKKDTQYDIIKKTIEFELCNNVELKQFTLFKKCVGNSFYYSYKTFKRYLKTFEDDGVIIIENRKNYNQNGNSSYVKLVNKQSEVIQMKRDSIKSAIYCLSKSANLLHGFDEYNDIQDDILIIREKLKKIDGK